jgi:hypothetical protein
VQVLLRDDHSPVGFVVQHLEDVQRLEDPPVVGERLTEPGRAAVAGDHPDQVVRAHRPCGQGSGDAEHVGPVREAPRKLDPVARELVERPVAGGQVKPPQAGVGR